MVRKNFSKSLCIIAGWVTLVEALVWFLVSLYSIGIYHCSVKFFSLEKGTSTWTRLYITYLMGSCDGATEATSLGYVFIPPSNSAAQLQIWMWIYVVASAVWIPTCMLLILASTKEVSGSRGALQYYTWVVMTSILIIIDLAGAIYHLVDVFSTTTPDDYAKFTGSSSWSSFTTGSSTSGVISWLPSLFISLFFCRTLTLWVVNIALVYGVYKACNAVAAYKNMDLQSNPLNSERAKDQFDQGSNPNKNSSRDDRAKTPTQDNEETRPRSPVSVLNVSLKAPEEYEEKPESPSVKQPSQYKVDSFGIPIEELSPSDPPSNQNERHFPRSPYQPEGQVFDFSGRLMRAESVKERFQDSPPPMARGVKVPPELNKIGSFSYFAGDQPQNMSRPLFRSNSRGEYPNIPHPDYTVADRRSANLEYVPNRFKVPSPKQPQSPGYQLSSYNQRSPTIPKLAPVPPKKPQLYPRSRPPIPEDSEMSHVKYMPQVAFPSQQQTYYTRQASENNNYNINKLY